MIDARALWKRLRLHARRTDGFVLLALAALVFYTVSKHEPWADEAQAWLARDFPWLRLVFAELRYEGHPAIWSAILSLAIHLLHLPYGYLGYLAGSVAIAGRPFSFSSHLPEAVAVSDCGFLFLSLSVHCCGPALCSYAVAGLPGCPFLSPRNCPHHPLRDRHRDSYPRQLLRGSHRSSLLRFLRRSTCLALEGTGTLLAAGIVALSTIFAVVVLLPRADSTLLAGIWAYQHGVLLLLLLGVGGTAFEYGFEQGYGHHQGLITIAFVTALWAGWPTATPLTRFIHEE